MQDKNKGKLSEEIRGRLVNVMEKERWWSRFWRKYKDLKIRDKILLSNVGVVLIMVLILGALGYGISRNLLVSQAIRDSRALVEQLSSNFNYAVQSMEDAVFMRTFSSDFTNMMRTDADGEYTQKQQYDRRKSVTEYAYNLNNFNRFIKTVIIQDANGFIYYVSAEGQEMEEQEQERCLAYEEASEAWGTTVWKPYDQEQIFASRLIFDHTSMRPLCVLSVGIDTSYFEKLYENIVADGTSDIVFLNREGEVLMESSSEGRRIAEAVMKKYDSKEVPGKEIYYQDQKYIYTTWLAEGKGVQVMNLISEKGITSEIYKLLNPLLIAAAAAILLSMLLAYGISQYVSSNINLLLGSIRKVSKGDFSQEIKPEAYDEIGMLASEFNYMSGQIRQLISTVSNEKLMKKNMELKALQFEYDSLQSKINPHFLYNTLESISSLAKLKKEPEIADSIYLLGRYLRETVSSKRKFWTLEEEIWNIEQYVRIQQLSYGDKLKVKIQVDEAFLNMTVPKLILQPLVENAIVHGLEPKIGRGTIQIAAASENRDVLITVSDDGVGMTENQLAHAMDGTPESDLGHTKVGIMAVHKRIQILYGDEYGVTIASEQQQGTRIRLRLPIEFEDEVEEDEL